MVKNQREMNWKGLFNDERGGTSKGNGKIQREEPFVNDFHDENWTNHEEGDMEVEQLQEILHLHSSDHPGMQLVAAPLTD